jgi:general secretion pathway protein D
MHSFSLALLVLLAGCARMSLQAPPAATASAHLQATDVRERVTTAAQLPAAVADVPPALPPAPRYSLDVRQVPVEQLLTAIAHDNRLDFDLHPGVEGLVTLSAYERPLPELIQRICEQAALRCGIDGDGHRLVVMPDTPFLRAYNVDYVNLARDMNGAVATSTQIATSNSAVEGAKSGSTHGNTSLTRIETKAVNHFWETLENNIRALLKESALPARKPHCAAPNRRNADRTGVDTADCTDAGGGGDDATFVVSHRETGILAVFASASQHQRVAEFIDRVQGAARRQVMVEATIVEVTLADGYRQGIDWSRWGSPEVNVHPRGALDASVVTPTVAYLSSLHDIKLDLLETFGTVKVLSSPKLSVLNNQTAILKVVEEVVYFLVDASTTEYGGDSDRTRTSATTTPQSVSVGLVMALTPQIGQSGEITLSVRPTISSISGFKDDPNPSLGSIPNRVPQIRTREIESVLRLVDGEIAVLGGLMEDKIDYDTGRIPLIGALPVLGELFTRRENSVRRTELVIFLRPRLIRQPGLNGDYASERTTLSEATAPVTFRHEQP